MKTIITILLGIILLSATTLTEKSTSQVFIHNRNLNKLSLEVSNYYKLGYRITKTEAQSVGTGNTWGEEGEVIVIMEK